MDKKTRRSSILKVRQQVDLFQEETDDGTTKITKDRRVSFQNMKRVQQFDKDGGKFLHNSPLKEKITDTMDSDGILTPRGRTMEMSQGEENTFQIFDKHNSTKNTTVDMELESDETMTRDRPTSSNSDTRRTAVDMSIDAECSMDNTMNVFNIPHITEKKTVIVERITTTTVIETEKRCSSKENMDDTMAIFNLTNHDEQEMEMATPQRNLATSRILGSNLMDDTAVIFNLNNTQSMDVVDEESMFVVPSAETTLVAKQRLPLTNEEPMNDTMQIFNTSNRNAQDMDISGISEKHVSQIPLSASRKVFDDCDNQSMDMDMESVMISTDTPAAVQDDTMAVFRTFVNEEPKKSPGKQKENRTDMTMDMVMEETIIDQTEVLQKTADILEIDACKQKDIQFGEEDMEVEQNEEEKGDKEETLVLSPEEKSETIVIAPNETIDLRTNVTVNLITDAGITNNSFGDQSDMVIEKTFDHVDEEEKTAETEEDSPKEDQTISSQSNVSQDPNTETEEIEGSPVENIELIEIYKALEDSHLSSSQMITETELLNNSKTIVEMDMDVSSYSSVHHRSIVNQSHRQMQSSIESPRRLLNDISIVNNRTQDISCISAFSNKRDIFEMNTSIRSSPRVSFVLEQNESIRVLSPAITLPKFDMAVSNIIWLKKGDGSDDQLPEAVMMEERVEKALVTTENEIEKIVESGKIEKVKVDGIRSGRMSKMSSDEKDVIYTSRKLAEQQLLLMRLNLAKEFSEQCSSETQLIKSELDQKLKYISDSEQYEQLKNELVELRKREHDYREAREVKKEWQEMKLKQAERMKSDLMEQLKNVVELTEARKAAVLQYEKSKREMEAIIMKEEERKMEIRNAVNQITRHRLTQ